MDTIPVDEVEPGDILLVTRRPEDALAQLIVDLDQSAVGFSHAGVAGEERGTIVCPYPLWDSLFDVGGVHHLSFDHFFGEKQAIHRLKLPAGVTSERARRLLRGYPENREGAFGWAKCVMVAATLHTLAAERRIGTAAVDAVLTAAVAAGEAWASPDDFYCAEFVAHLYGLQFTVDHLRPPNLLPKERPHPTVARPRIDDLKRKAGQAILGWFASGNQSEMLEHFGRVIEKNNPAFFDLGFERLDQLLYDWVRKTTRRVLGPDPIFGPVDWGPAGDLEWDSPPPVTLVPPDAIPYALVTPRMLADWGDGTDLIKGSPDVGDIGWKPYE